MVTTLTKGQQYTDPMGNTGTVGFDSQTGKALADGGTTTIPDTTITADSLAPVAPLVLPETTPETASQEIINSSSASTEVQKIADQDKAEKTGATSDISKLLSDIGVVEGKESGYATQAGADAAKEQSDKYQSLIDVESKALKNYKDELYRNPNLTTTLVGRLATEQERKSASYISDQLINKSIVDRDYDRAISQAERKVEAELAPLKRELDAKKFIFDANIDGWNASEKSVLDNIIKKEERAYDEQVKTKNDIEALKIEARKNGAPDSVINAMAKATTLDEALASTGSYLMSFADKKAQAELYAINNPSSSSTGLVVPESIKDLKGADRTALTEARATLSEVAELKAIISRNASNLGSLDVDQTEDAQRFRQLRANIVDKLARERTGAVIGKDERRDFKKILGVGFSQLSLKDSQQVLDGLTTFEQKHKEVQTLIDPDNSITNYLDQTVPLTTADSIIEKAIGSSNGSSTLNDYGSSKT